MKLETAIFLIFALVIGLAIGACITSEIEHAKNVSLRGLDSLANPGVLPADPQVLEFMLEVEFQHGINLTLRAGRSLGYISDSDSIADKILNAAWSLRETIIFARAPGDTVPISLIEEDENSLNQHE